ncbi:MAG: NUDIX hydrolase [Elusimicrobia bacterium]|nr:MAG: NUDIX hydrolase [Elusimicrobiota bacterium]
MAVVMAVERQFTATGFVVDGDRTLLLFHKKLQMWLPPGGHIDPGETPDAAVVREIKEETGLDVEIVPEVQAPFGPSAGVTALERPRIVQLEDIPDPKGFHQHIDLIYFCRPTGGRLNPAEAELEQLRWFTYEELADTAITDEVRDHARHAIEEIG